MLVGITLVLVVSSPSNYVLNSSNAGDGGHEQADGWRQVGTDHAGLLRAQYADGHEGGNEYGYVVWCLVIPLT